MTGQRADRTAPRLRCAWRGERGALLAMLLALLAAGAAADPGPATVSRSADPRLERKVTLKLPRTPLSEVVAQLGRQTGVRLAAGAEVADDPAVVFVTDLPLAEVMDRLASLFNYRWNRSGTAPAYRYVLTQDRESAAAEQALRDQDRLQVLVALEEPIRNQLRAAQQSGDRQQQALLGLVAQLAPAQWKNLLAGETILFSTAPEPGAGPLSAAAASDLLPEASRSVDGPARSDLIQVRVWLTIQEGPAFATANLRIRPAFPPGDARLQTVLGGTQVAGMVRRSVPQASPPDAAWDADPVLGRKRPFKVDAAALGPVNRRGPRVYEILPAIAESYGVNLIADAYRQQRRIGPLPPAGQDLPLYEVLNRFILPGAAWRKEGDVLEVRGHSWYQDRLAEIPDRMIRYWAARLRERPELSLDEVAALAVALRDEQFDAFGEALLEAGLRWDEAASWRGNLAMMGNREMLRAYGSLRPAQRQALRAGKAVAEAQMPPAAREWLRLACDREERTRIAAMPAGGGSGGALRLAKGATLIQRRVVRVGGDPGPGEPPPAANPAAPDGAAPHQQLNFRYERGSGPAAVFSLYLPTVLRDPAPPGGAAPGTGPGSSPPAGGAGQAADLSPASAGAKAGVS